MTNLNQYSHKIGKNFWHIEFVTKYRYKMFGKFKQKNLIEGSIRKICKNHKILIHTLSVMPDHIHMRVTLPHYITESKGMQLIKGGLAYHFFKNNLNRGLRLLQGHLWSRGGCATTVGYNNVDIVDNYIKNQAQHQVIA